MEQYDVSSTCLTKSIYDNHIVKRLSSFNLFNHSFPPGRGLLTGKLLLSLTVYISKFKQRFSNCAGDSLQAN